MFFMLDSFGLRGYGHLASVSIVQVIIALHGIPLVLPRSCHVFGIVIAKKIVYSFDVIDLNALNVLEKYCHK